MSDDPSSPTPPEAPSSAAPKLPPLPTALLDPRPILAVGTIAWLLALLALMMLDAPQRQLALCGAGVVVGLLGGMVYFMQRRAVQRGAAGAQQGLDFHSDWDSH